MADARVLLLGEANPYGGDPHFALWDEPEGASGDRLRRILGLRPPTYRALHRANLCPTAWNARGARQRAAVILADEMSRPWDVVVALGRKVAGALEWAQCALSGRRLALPAWSCTTLDLDWLRPVSIVALPHPSGRCLEWNKRENVLLARRMLAEVAPGVPWGEARDCRCASARCTCGGGESPATPALLPGEQINFAEPRTTDYCRRCGESPDSGTHLFGHEYEAP